MMGIRTCTSSIYASTYSQMNPEFGISSIVGTLGLSLFVLGSMLITPTYKLLPC